MVGELGGGDDVRASAVQYRLECDGMLTPVGELAEPTGEDPAKEGVVRSGGVQFLAEQGQSATRSMETCI